MKRFFAFSLLLAVPALADLPEQFTVHWQADSVSLAPTSDTKPRLIALPSKATLQIADVSTAPAFTALGLPVPTEESAHEKISVTLTFHFLRDGGEIASQAVLVDKTGVFVPSIPSPHPHGHATTANLPLSTSTKILVPEATDQIVIENEIADRASGKSRSKTSSYAVLDGQESVFVAPSSARYDDRKVPEMERWTNGGKSLRLIYDPERAMNVWLTAVKPLEDIKNASQSGGDLHTRTCLARDDSRYYTSWSELPEFEIAVRYRFNDGVWVELPQYLLPPEYAAYDIVHSFTGPRQTLPAVYRGRLEKQSQPVVDTQSLPIPSTANHVEFQFRLHAFYIARYSEPFSLSYQDYVGKDCIRLWQDGQRLELFDIWDTPDHTPSTTWFLQVN